MKVMESHSFSIDIDLDDAKIEFIKNITGKEDTQEATEQFAAACVFSYLDPNDILSQIKSSNTEEK